MTKTNTLGIAPNEETTNIVTLLQYRPTRIQDMLTSSMILAI